MGSVKYFEPAGVQEASEILLKEGGGARVVAGGTDILVRMKRRQWHVTALVNLKRIGGLNGIRIEGDRLIIGSLSTLTDLMENALVRDNFPCLARAAGLMASWQVRNIATVGGNICNASPAADLVPPLLCLDSVATVAGAAGSRKIPLTEFFMGPGRTALTHGEIVIGFAIPLPLKAYKTVFMKFGVREALDIAIASCCVSAKKDGTRLSDIRIALGSVSPAPMRARGAEKLACRAHMDTGGIASSAAEECSPIDDIRASAWYRKEMVRVLVRRCIEEISS